MKLTNRLVARFLITACIGSACNAVDNGESDTAAPEARALIANASSYFIVTRPDQRRCASPLCGGYFVQAVNLDQTRCADGTSAPDCHAFRLDFSSSGIAPEVAEKFEQTSFAAKQGLVRGTLITRPFGGGLSEDVLVVAEAWAGRALTVPRGPFHRLTATGQVCITFPCDSFKGEKLNTPKVSLFNAVDLAASGAPAADVENGNEALHGEGVLAAGRSIPISGPAGRGQDFRASEFYLRIPSCGRATSKDDPACGPRRCGSRGLPPCDANQYCDFPAGSQCGASDQGGVCRPRPQACLAIFNPVCGCDGQTYSNACQAAAVGVDVASEGACRLSCAGPSPAPGACETDADCRTFSDYCTGCDCRALSSCQKDPVCPGPGVQCFVDPCRDQTASCVGGQCVLSSGF
jgi:hypothetical protein